MIDIAARWVRPCGHEDGEIPIGVSRRHNNGDLCLAVTAEDFCLSNLTIGKRGFAGIAEELSDDFFDESVPWGQARYSLLIKH